MQEDFILKNLLRSRLWSKSGTRGIGQYFSTSNSRYMNVGYILGWEWLDERAPAMELPVAINAGHCQTHIAVLRNQQFRNEENSIKKIMAGKSKLLPEQEKATYQL